jgi:hypothetical protein
LPPVRAKLFVAVAALSLLLPTQPELPLATGAYVQDVTAASAKVCWVGHPARSVELKVAARDGTGPVPAVAFAETGDRRVARIDGLRAATVYDFTAVLDGRARDDLSGSFRTPPAGTSARVRFAVLGDSGGLPWWVNVSRSPLFGALARAGLLPPVGRVAGMGERLAELAPEFWLHTGDVIYPRGEQRHYGPGFFAPFAAALRRAPVYPVLGNHDWETDHGRPLLANFELPAGGDEQFFTFAWGPVRVVGLNCNRSVGLAPGLAFLEQVLERAEEPWRVVVEHFPPWSASDQGDRADLIDRLVPALQRARVDLLLCGHDHNYQRFRKEGELQVVITGGGGKSLYRLRDHPRLVHAASEYHLCEVTCEPTRLALRAVALDGREIDAFTLEKPAAK